MNRFKQMFLFFVLGIVLAGVHSTGAHAQDKIAAAGKMKKPSVVRFLASPFPKPLPPSTRVRIAVLDVPGTLIRANNIALLLTRFRRRELEEKIGMKLELANLSQNRQKPMRGNVIYYRVGFLRAAMLVAKAVPGEQSVMPMSKKLAAKTGVDVEIHLQAKPR